MDVKAKVEKLIRKHKTNDPFEIAKQENIHIIYIMQNKKIFILFI